MSDQTEKLLDSFRDAKKRHAKAHSEAAFLEHYRKVVLARAMKAAHEFGFVTVASQDREAHASDEYLAHIKGLKEANEQARLWEAEAREAELAIEIWRTEQASERLERKAYNVGPSYDPGQLVG